MSTYSLTALACGVPAFMLTKILTSCYYAQQDVKTPVYCACISLLINIIFSLTLIQFFAHAGLALAISLAAYVNVYLLIKKFNALNIRQALMHETSRIIMASVIMGGICYASNPNIYYWLAHTKVYQLIMLNCLILFGACSYAIVLYLLGVTNIYNVVTTKK